MSVRAPITVVIPTIPTRGEMLLRAIQSVQRQTILPEDVLVRVDINREGAAATRNHLLAGVKTPWVAFLDDDDEFLPQHLETLHTHALVHGADYVYSWFHVIGGTDPFPANFGKPFDPEHPVETTITALVRTELAQRVGFAAMPNEEGLAVPPAGDDRRFTLGCIAAGAKIVHVPERTWNWHHHSSNTSGQPDRW